MKILIAEDDLSSRNILKAILRKAGHEVVETVDGGQAWETLQQPDPPRLAILDWMMPKMSGIELTQQLRALKAEQSVYIILITVRTDKSDIVTGLGAGANDFVTKPYNSAELLARVDVGCRMISLQQQLAASVQALENQQKLEALGVLAGGIAHDFNNLLAGIFGYVELAYKVSTEQKVSTYLAKTLGTLQRARGLTDELLTFARGGSPVRKRGQLFPFVEQRARRALDGSSVACACETPARLSDCDFDRSQIGRVIDNIVTNARQAMPDGGTITISAKELRLAPREHMTLPAGNYIRISISDHGVGMSAEMLPKIFTPFYSARRGGHGLGLATSYSIVHRHGGGIDVESEPGHGSTFHIYLPAAGDSAAREAATPQFARPEGGTILAMDDEEIIRETIGEMLQMLGYETICTSNGAETIAAFLAAKKDGRAITALIFDLIIIGGMGGIQTLEEIRKIDPNVPVFVASGYADDPAMADPAAFGFTGSIRKPFSITELEEMLEMHLRPGTDND